MCVLTYRLDWKRSQDKSTHKIFTCFVCVCVCVCVCVDDVTRLEVHGALERVQILYFTYLSVHTTWRVVISKLSYIP